MNAYAVLRIPRRSAMLNEIGNIQPVKPLQVVPGAAAI